MPRDEFSNTTKIALAQRAGYQCSICGLITVGPSREGLQAVNLIGVAAHITAASKGGRRYDESMSPAQRSGIENGIWLCNNHADYIDGDKDTFSVAELQSLKRDHEEKVRLQQSGIRTANGAITRIEVNNVGWILNSFDLNLAERNVIIGENGAGKTLICEFIASLSNRKYLKRWARKNRQGLSAFCNIWFFKNQAEKFSIRIDPKGIISYALNDFTIPVLFPAINVFYMDTFFWDFVNSMKEEKREKSSNVELLAGYFRLTRHEFISIVSSINTDRKFFVNDLSFSADQKDLLTKVSDSPTVPKRRFNALSGGEQDRVMVEIMLKIATYYAKFNFTILLLEYHTFKSMDVAGVNRLLEVIKEENFGFQTIFTSTENPNLIIEGYKVHQLELRTGKATQ
ncbi:ATP-binding cassette domain-containing protein [Pedobacter frigidisoli]|uniref:ATP-binding cassette domain-containing protein n=1 Tax=Pedobacter frigidisoli TaxID=2530455 RepID=A0A4R0P846_9SPHI|nr:ATP-binding cassette domain-containing protein [Pedobacter frigidisoli]TCD12975.1 ATP-binding cassette domain-containing protein [Pedobacter frigidisoli]